MPRIYVFDLFDSYMKGGLGVKPALFGLVDFSQFRLEAAGYELIGDRSDFHFYEKHHVAACHKRYVRIVLKCYFLSENAVGNGVGVGPGVRLISLLRRYQIMRKVVRICDENIKFYFSDKKTKER